MLREAYEDAVRAAAAPAAAAAPLAVATLDSDRGRRAAHEGLRAASLALDYHGQIAGQPGPEDSDPTAVGCRPDADGWPRKDSDPSLWTHCAETTAEQAAAAAAAARTIRHGKALQRMAEAGVLFTSL